MPATALVPPLDDLTRAEAEIEGLAAVPRCVELTVRAPRDTDVVDLDDVARCCDLPVTHGDVLDDEVCRRLLTGDGNVGFAHSVNLSDRNGARISA